MPIPVQGYAHVRLTVTDIARSRAFYDDVFGFTVAYELPPDADETTREALSFLFGGVIYQVGGGLFGLRPVAPGADRFDEDRVGLDHVSFTVGSRDELVQAVQRLEEHGVAHGEVNDLTDFGIAILSFSDPDGVHLELTAPLS